MQNKTCETCDGKCCKYIAIEIDAPEELNDFENIKWYVAHENVNVFVNDDNEWHVEFITPCEFLGEENLCMNYENRPQICRDYHQDNCHFHNDYEEKFTFKNLKEIEKYIEEVFKKGKHEIPETEEEE